MEKFFNKVLTVDLKDEEQSERIIKALNCKTRRDILRLLSGKTLSIWEIAERLNVPLSTTSEHVSVLLRAGIISVVRKEGNRGQSKILSRQYEQIRIDLVPASAGSQSKAELYREEIPIGSYTDFKIGKYCGMLSEEGYVGRRDDPSTFYAPKRHEAQLLWFDYGYLEYKIPLKEVENKTLAGIALSLELCSEAPGYNENWKSDVFFEINGVPLCTLTLPGDFGARQGALTPKWWKAGTQYGLLKKIEVRKKGTFLDGEPCSDICIADLAAGGSPSLLTLRIGVKEDAKNRGGVNLFGSKYGDHPQHILLDLIYKE